MVEQLLKLSRSIAHDVAAVQGAGGNASVKNDNIMWIKASGTLLAEMTDKNGWTTINLPQWREDFLSFEGVEDEFVGINVKNTLGIHRASIETGLHALISHKYVLHTHSVYANVFLCAGRTEEIIAYLRTEDVEVVIVPMCAPGLQLARLLDEQLKNRDVTQSLIVLLENHGIAVASNDFSETIRLHQLFYTGIREYFKLPKFESPLITSDLNSITHEVHYWYADSDIIKVMCDFIRNSKLFFPDQVVYVNNRLSRQIVVCVDDNSIKFVDMSKQAAKNTAEILASVLYLYKNIEIPYELPEELSIYIANMSGEKYRQHLEK